jgi:hypothetical protein
MTISKEEALEIINHYLTGISTESKKHKPFDLAQLKSYIENSEVKKKELKTPKRIKKDYEYLGFVKKNTTSNDGLNGIMYFGKRIPNRIIG